MIIGSGNIAKCLTDREGAIFFASGVSNSRDDNINGPRRESALIMDTWHSLSPYEKKTLCIFYFSSVAVTFPHISFYYGHKWNMEEMIKRTFNHYVILRIGNLIGDTNPNTFINYIKNQRAQGLIADIRDEYRYMIDGATLNTLCQTLPLNQKIELTVATKIAKVRDLL